MMIFSQLKQWSVRRKVAVSSVLSVCVLAAGVAVVLLSFGGGDEDVLRCPERVVLPGGRMVAGEQAGPCWPVHCYAVEIYDAQLAAVQVQGSNAGFKGSGYGCIPVCVWHNDGDLAVEPEEIMFYRSIPDSLVIDYSGVIAPRRNYLFQNPTEVFGPGIHGTRVAFAASDSEAKPVEVRVSPHGGSCHIYDFLGNQLASQPVPPDPILPPE